MPRETALARAKTAATLLREEVAALREQLDAVVEDRDTSVAQAVEERNRWRNERIADPEAEALSACVRAFDTMAQAQTERASNTYGNSPTSTRGVAWRTEPWEQYGDRVIEQPPAHANPVGRVLLALAARYGIPIEAVKPEPKVDPGQKLISAPAELADQIEALINRTPFG